MDEEIYGEEIYGEVVYDEKDDRYYYSCKECYTSFRGVDEMRIAAKADQHDEEFHDSHP